MIKIMTDKTKLKEILKELIKPKKYEVGFVEARRVVDDGLAIIGLNATDILGFAKEANETRARRSKGAQAWFKRMYEDGWRFPGQFEYEGILHAGFILMERELPNKRLEELIETLDDETVVRTGSAMELDRGPELPKIVEINPDAIQPLPDVFKKERMEITHNALKEMGYKEEEITEYIVPKAVKEPKEGFEDELSDLITEYQTQVPTDEEQFFKDTGKNAVWRGKETKAFKSWKENRD